MTRTVWRLIKGLGVALAVMVLSILPPGLHLVLGPLSPLIGGFAAGVVGELRAGEASVLGLVEATAAGLVVGFILPVLADLELGTATLWFFGVGAAIYAGTLSGVAAYFGGQQGQRAR